MDSLSEGFFISNAEGSPKKGRIAEIYLCEITGERITAGRCLAHPDPEMENDAFRRGFAYTAGCAARYVHNEWVPTQGEQ